MRVQLVFDDLRRCAASRASVLDVAQGVDQSQLRGVGDTDVEREAVGVLLSAGVRLADKVSQIAVIIAANGSDGDETFS